MEDDKRLPQLPAAGHLCLESGIGRYLDRSDKLSLPAKELLGRLARGHGGNQPAPRFQVKLRRAVLDLEPPHPGLASTKRRLVRRQRMGEAKRFRHISSTVTRIGRRRCKKGSGRSASSKCGWARSSRQASAFIALLSTRLRLR